MQEFIPLAAVLAVIAAAAVLIALINRWERRQAATWTVAAEGVFDRVEHRRYRRSQWSGMPMLPAVTLVDAEITIVHLEDGRSFAVDGRIAPDMPKGASVRVRRNGLGHLKLERLA
ncbi:MAG TPA: hypothetical protein VL426_00940 [Candidatus Binatia bacterium]|jgi:hypothetical protein|nr:hypothetical protein [Candidatus Binatia bacterium]